MSRDPSANVATAPAISDQEIRERAYDIWERHHRPDGFDARFWLMAKRELIAEHQTKAASESKSTATESDA